MRHWAVLLFEKWDKVDLEKFDVVSKDSNGDFLLSAVVVEKGEEISAKSGQKQLKPNKWATGVIVEWDDSKDGDLSYIIEEGAAEYNKKHQNILDKNKLYLSGWQLA